MDGAEAGLDVHATMALYRSKWLTDYKRGVLRSVLAGAVCTRAKLFKAVKVVSPICEACGREPEDTDHLWWRCPAWASCRQRHWDTFFAFKDGWPACFRLCGLMPSAHEAFAHLVLDVVSDSGFSASSQGETADGVVLPRSLQLDRWARRLEFFVDGRVVVFGCEVKAGWRGLFLGAGARPQCGAAAGRALAN